MKFRIKRFTFGLVDDSLGSTDSKHTELLRRRKESAVENDEYTITLTVFNPFAVGPGEANERKMRSVDTSCDRKAALDVIKMFDCNGIELMPQSESVDSIDRLTRVSRNNAFEEMIHVKCKADQISAVLNLMASTIQNQSKDAGKTNCRSF